MLPEIDLKDYTYTLPEARIAQYPLVERDSAKLLVYQHGKVCDSVFRDLAQHLPSDALLVMNETRVIPARLVFQRETGARIEVFCLSPLAPETETVRALQVCGRTEWECLVGNARRWKPDEVLRQTLTDELGSTFVLRAEKLAQMGDTFRIAFSWEPSEWKFAEMLEKAGKAPLPPYMRREALPADREQYQTVYAAQAGSVAAPTAGLHFTQPLLEKLETKGIRTQKVCLHVGAGTFKPIQTTSIAEHQMHAEPFTVTKEIIEALLNHTGPIVAVGTTSMRTLESLYWLGFTLLYSKTDLPPFLNQWAPYDHIDSLLPSKKIVLQALLAYMERNKLERITAATELIIVPGYHFHMVDGLITNFHQPDSTLLLLVGAFVGPSWRNIYDHALSNDYRFLSYGDGSLLWTN
jgi:S-adenosylmethionine:tRNA ribosyltransferase-isomerase